jgi:hypothetical protein
MITAIVRRLQQLEELMGTSRDEEKVTIEIVAVSPDGTVCRSGKVIEVPVGKGKEKFDEH